MLINNRFKKKESSSTSFKSITIGGARFFLNDLSETEIHEYNLKYTGYYCKCRNSLKRKINTKRIFKNFFYLRISI